MKNLPITFAISLIGFTQLNAQVAGPPSISVQARVCLQGPYEHASGLMNDDLRMAGLLPLSEPHTDHGYSQYGSGDETTSAPVLSVAGVDAIVDWIFVELRDQFDSTRVLVSANGLLQRDGDVVDLDGLSPLEFSLPADNYFVAIRHRNHLGIMSAQAIALDSTSTLVDFSDGSIPTYGTSAQTLQGNVFCMWSGDVVNDGIVAYVGTNNDRDPILQTVGGAVPTHTISAYSSSDLNLDGQVKYTGSFNDRDLILQNIGGSVPTNQLFGQLPRHQLSNTEMQIFNWLNAQQMSNGLVKSVENGNVISLYDNALAAMAFMLVDDFTRAENIFDFFNARIASELQSGPGGFSQFRDSTGTPNNHRWMGDNAWLLIALNNYKFRTGSSTYDSMRSELATWLISLQDSDGGLFAGYAADNSLLNYKVTEGMIDAFNAVDGFSTFHSQLLNYLEIDRWYANDSSLVSWPSNPTYLYALDIHPWAYSIFEDFPEATLTFAQRFLTTQSATLGGSLTGYCFDDDLDAVWLEGTGQMALAFGLAGMHAEKQFYLSEMESVLVQSSTVSNGKGFVYASNAGTSYGGGALWVGADTKIALSSGVWYLFATHHYNPFQVSKNKGVPNAQRFWAY